MTQVLMRKFLRIKRSRCTIHFLEILVKIQSIYCLYLQNIFEPFNVNFILLIIVGLVETFLPAYAQDFEHLHTQNSRLLVNAYHLQNS